MDRFATPDKMKCRKTLKFRKKAHLMMLLLAAMLLYGCADESAPTKYTYRGWNILSSHRENGLKTLDQAVAYGINHIELSHYQLCHDLKDLRKQANREAVNFFIEQAHQRGIPDVFVWDHAFYPMDYYPERFRVKVDDPGDFTHHTKKFQGGLYEQLNLDDPAFWQWVYQDYDSLLSLAPNLDGIVLTFIETGSYVIHQYSDKLPLPEQKLAALVDSLGAYFIDRNGLQLTIRTFIYNQFEKQVVLGALQRIQRDDIRVMIKMVPHDWFLTYPYQDYVEDIPFPVVIEYDGGMEYAGENIIANTFADYFSRAFRHYDSYPGVTGFCVRTDRYEETAAVGTPGELNLYLISQLAAGNQKPTDSMTLTYLRQTYGEAAAPLIKPAFDSAFSIILSSMYTLGQHTANHSRLNFHRKNIYQSHTTGEWYPPGEQMHWVGHGVNAYFHNYKEVINGISFPAYKTDTAGLRKDIPWVLDSGWLDPGVGMTPKLLEHIVTEKQYAVKLAGEALAQIEAALPLIKNRVRAERLFHTFRRTELFTRERKAIAQAVYGYQLWCKGKDFRNEALRQLIVEGMAAGDSLITEMENYPVHVPLGQWRWHRDREAFEVYRKAIFDAGWEETGLPYAVLERRLATDR